MLKKSGLALLLLWMLGAMAYADMTGKEIINEQIQRHEVDTEEATEIMLLVDKNGDREKRVLKRYSKKNDQNLNRFLLVFTNPVDINGTALLTWEQNNGMDDQWMYLPAQGRLKRIAQGNKKAYFMGTDFTYEDMELEDMDSFNYKILRSEQLEYFVSKKEKTADCWVIESVPANKKAKHLSSYSKRILWVDKSNFFTLKIQFFDKTDEHIKTQTSHNVVHVKGDAWRGNKTLMDNHKRDHKTLSGVKERKIDQLIDDKMFTENYIISERHIQ
jgi:hypothetical protein